MSTNDPKPATRQLEVQIMGQSYLLASPADGEAALIAAVEKVDSAMCRIRDAGKVKARDRIAVLASLNLAFELIQLESRSTTSANATAPVASGASHASDDPRLHALLQRLDAALGQDGQLL